jgi:hypothetical protein
MLSEKRRASAKGVVSGEEPTAKLARGKTVLIAPMLATDNLDALLETALTRAGEPLNVAAVLKALPAGQKPAKKEVQLRLGELVEGGRIHRWPGAAEKFSALSPQAFARGEVLRVLASGTLTEAEIKQRVPTSARALVKAALAVLAGERVVMKHPKLGRRTPFGLGPPDAADYLPAEIATAFKRLTKMGFKEVDLQSALRRYQRGVEVSRVAADDGAQEILTAMPRLNNQASRGALVYVVDLRAALTRQFPDKESFDRAVLELAQQGKVQLQSHAWPGRLSESERNAMVPNGQGGFFDAIGLRLE